MSLDPAGLHKDFERLYPFLKTNNPDESIKRDFIDFVKSMTHTISNKINDSEEYLLNSVTGQSKIQDDLIKILFYDVIKTQDIRILIKVADLWSAVLNEALLFFGKVPSENDISDSLQTELYKFLDDPDIYQEISKEIKQVLNSGFIDQYYKYEIFPLRKSFYLHRSGFFADFNNNIPIISAMTKYGYIDDPVGFVERLIATSDSRFSGAEEENYRIVLSRLLNDLRVLQDKNLNDEFVDSDGSLSNAFNHLVKKKYILCTISEFVKAFAEGENRTRIIFGKVRNKAEAGIIIRTFSKYCFPLDDDSLNAVKLRMKSRNRTFEELTESIKRYEDTTETYGDLNLDVKFIDLMDEVIEFLND